MSPARRGTLPGLGDLEWWRHLPSDDATGKPKGSGGWEEKEEEKAGVAGWGSAERHLWSPVRCEPQERSQQ